MYKIITPRGGGRTYQICKYAIKNDCDIIVPALSSIQHIVTIIMQICYDSNGEYMGWKNTITTVRRITAMSDRKRDKNSKSTYMRAARKQRMIENQFMQEIEKAQEAPASKYNKKSHKQRREWDDEE